MLQKWRNSSPWALARAVHSQPRSSGGTQIPSQLRFPRVTISSAPISSNGMSRVQRDSMGPASWVRQVIFRATVSFFRATERLSWRRNGLIVRWWGLKGQSCFGVPVLKACTILGEKNPTCNSDRFQACVVELKKNGTWNNGSLRSGLRLFSWKFAFDDSETRQTHNRRHTRYHRFQEDVGAPALEPHSLREKFRVRWREEKLSDFSEKTGIPKKNYSASDARAEPQSKASGCVFFLKWCFSRYLMYRARIAKKVELMKSDKTWDKTPGFYRMIRCRLYEKCTSKKKTAGE